MTNSEDDHDEGDGNPREMDRRRFGKFLAVGVGGLALGGAARSQPPESPSATLPGGTKNRYDVIIVGAGLSGLIAARELKRASPNLKLKVLEANTNVGGRMLGRPTKGTAQTGYLDYGGQWVGKTQYEMQALAKDLQIPLFDSYENGRSIESWKGGALQAKKWGFNGDVSELLEGCTPPDPATFPKGAKCLPPPFADCDPSSADNSAEAALWKKFLKISATVNRIYPWETEGALALDSNTFQVWLDEQGVKKGDYPSWMTGLISRIGGSGGFDPHQVSLLHMAWTQTAGPQHETPEKWLMLGGAGQIPARLAAEPELEGCIDVRCVVDSIDEEGLGMVVRYHRTAPLGPDTYLTIAADAVIVAVPPPLRAGLLHPQSKYPEHVEFSKSSPMGSISKVHVVYEKAFWRENCWSGSTAGDRPCEFIADSSPPPHGEPGILTTFFGGSNNEKYAGTGKSQDEILATVVADLVYYFGDQAKQYVDHQIVQWAKSPFTGGGAFTSYLGTNVWTRSAKKGWREPAGNIFWAGTETSDQWPGYFDGAVRAGKRAAQEVLERYPQKRCIPAAGG